MRKNSSLMVFAAGLLAGWQLKRYLESDTFKHHKERSTELYTEAKGRLTTRLESLGNTIAEVDKTKYRELVSEIVTRLGQEQTLPTAEIKQLQRELIADFKHVIHQLKVDTDTAANPTRATSRKSADKN